MSFIHFFILSVKLDVTLIIYYKYNGQRLQLKSSNHQSNKKNAVQYSKIVWKKKHHNYSILIKLLKVQSKETCSVTLCTMFPACVKQSLAKPNVSCLATCRKSLYLQRKINKTFFIVWLFIHLNKFYYGRFSLYENFSLRNFFLLFLIVDKKQQHLRHTKTA